MLAYFCAGVVIYMVDYHYKFNLLSLMAIMLLKQNKMPKVFSIAVLILIAISCSDKRQGDEKAVHIVEQCIEEHGGKRYRDMDVSFDFRQFRIHLKQKDGVFLYERTTRDSLNNEVHDRLTNESFVREINGKKQDLTKEDLNKYKEGLNAMAYFALLPYKLSEPAVRLKYLGETTLENEKYHKIGVSFEADGGGKDYHDEFCHWINQSKHTLDYLSYASGGPRFRKATKRVKVDGVVFQDYENYEVPDSTLATFNYDQAYKAGNVKLLSKIEQQNYSSRK